MLVAFFFFFVIIVVVAQNNQPHSMLIRKSSFASTDNDETWCHVNKKESILNKVHYGDKISFE